MSNGIEIPEERNNLLKKAEIPEARKKSTSRTSTGKNSLSIETPELRRNVMMRSKGKCVYCGKQGTTIVTKPETSMIKFMDRKQLRSTDFECVCEKCLNKVEKKSQTNSGKGIARKMLVCTDTGFIEYR